MYALHRRWGYTRSCWQRQIQTLCCTPMPQPASTTWDHMKMHWQWLFRQATLCSAMLERASTRIAIRAAALHSLQTFLTLTVMMVQFQTEDSRTQQYNSQLCIVGRGLIGVNLP